VNFDIYQGTTTAEQADLLRSIKAAEVIVDVVLKRPLLILDFSPQKVYGRVEFKESGSCRIEKKRSAHTASPSERGRPARRKVARVISAPRPGEDGSSKGMLLGYARVSTIDQNLALQRDALAEAGRGRIFTEQLSGAVTDRPRRALRRRNPSHLACLTRTETSWGRKPWR
jgi:hypothetical protein